MKKNAKKMNEHSEAAMKERFLDFQEWMAKQTAKGYDMSGASKNVYAQSYDRFAQRYRELESEAALTGKKIRVLHEMKRRSFKGGTDSQTTYFYNAIRDVMNDLKNSDDVGKVALYNKLNEKYDFNHINILDVTSGTAHLSSKYYNKDYEKPGESGGILQLMYFELKNTLGSGFVFNFSSPN